MLVFSIQHDASSPPLSLVGGDFVCATVTQRIRNEICPSFIVVHNAGSTRTECGIAYEDRELAVQVVHFVLACEIVPQIVWEDGSGLVLTNDDRVRVESLAGRQQLLLDQATDDPMGAQARFIRSDLVCLNTWATEELQARWRALCPDIALNGPGIRGDKMSASFLSLVTTVGDAADAHTAKGGGARNLNLHLVGQTFDSWHALANEASLHDRVWHCVGGGRAWPDFFLRYDIPNVQRHAVCIICTENRPNIIPIPCGHPVCNECCTRIAENRKQEEERQGRPSAQKRMCVHCRGPIECFVNTDTGAFVSCVD